MQETCGNTHLEVVTHDVKVLLFKQLMTWSLVCRRQKNYLENLEIQKTVIISNICY